MIQSRYKKSIHSWYTTLYQLCIESASTSHQSWYTVDTKSWYKVDTEWYTTLYRLGINFDAKFIQILCINFASIFFYSVWTLHQSWYIVDTKSWYKVDTELIHNFVSTFIDSVGTLYQCWYTFHTKRWYKVVTKLTHNSVSTLYQSWYKRCIKVDT